MFIWLIWLFICEGNKLGGGIDIPGKGEVAGGVEAGGVFESPRLILLVFLFNGGKLVS